MWVKIRKKKINTLHNTPKLKKFVLDSDRFRQTSTKHFYRVNRVVLNITMPGLETIKAKHFCPFQTNPLVTPANRAGNIVLLFHSVLERFHSFQNKFSLSWR